MRKRRSVSCNLLCHKMSKSFLKQPCRFLQRMSVFTTTCTYADRDRMLVFTTPCTYADRDRMSVFTTTCTYADRDRMLVFYNYMYLC
jgi:hypothetical protein